MTLEILLPYLAGVVALPIINILKARFALGGDAAVLLSFFVSLALAAAAIALTGGFGGEDLMADVAKVFAVATIAYKLLPAPIANLGA